MAKEIEKMREIRTRQVETRKALKNREEANKALRVKITPIWTLEKDKRTKELETLTNALIDGRARVRSYQRQLRVFKTDLKATNRDYDLAKGE
jgi:hypothetical protein